MSDTSEINYRQVARQLVQSGKSQNEVIAQLVKLDLEEYSARALLDNMYTPQKSYNMEAHWRTPAIIGSIILIVGSIITYNAIRGVTSPENPLAHLFMAIRILGVGLFVYTIIK